MKDAAAPEPFRHEIRVTWGDCDPAKIAYTGRIPWWALDAINAFWEHHLGGRGWFQMELDHDFGMPFVHMDLDFFAPVTPRHRLVCEVVPVKLGTTSITFRVTGLQDGNRCFEGRFVSVFMAAEAFTKRPPTDEVRAVIEAHLQPDPAR